MGFDLICDRSCYCCLCGIIVSVVVSHYFLTVDFVVDIQYSLYCLQVTGSGSVLLSAGG